MENWETLEQTLEEAIESILGNGSLLKQRKIMAKGKQQKRHSRSGRPGQARWLQKVGLTPIKVMAVPPYGWRCLCRRSKTFGVSQGDPSTNGATNTTNTS